VGGEHIGQSKGGGVFVVTQPKNSKKDQKCHTKKKRKPLIWLRWDESRREEGVRRGRHNPQGPVEIGHRMGGEGATRLKKTTLT